MKNEGGGTRRFRRRPVYPFALVSALCLMLLAGGCSQDKKGKTTSSDNSAIAVVNGERISRDSYEKDLSRMKKKFSVDRYKKFSNEEMLWMKTTTLNRMVQEVLFRQEAEKNNIHVTRDEFDEEVQKVRSGYEEDSFERYLQMEDISLEDWHARIQNNILAKNLINKLVNSKVTIEDGELTAYFNSHPDEFNSEERVRAFHIMLETEEDARKYMRELRGGKKDFSELARAVSIGAERENGGDLGFVEASQMPEEFDPIFKLNKSEISDIIRTPYGYHIFKIVEKIPKRKMSFAEARKSIYEKLLSDRQEELFGKWVQGVKDNAKIEINHELLGKIG